MGLIFAVFIMSLYQPHMNSTIKNNSKGYWRIKRIKREQWHKKERVLTHTSKIRSVLKEKMEKRNGQNICSMHIALIIKEDKFLWLSRGGLRGETESDIIATHDQALQKDLCKNIWSKHRALIIKEDKFLWLSRGDLKGETVSEIIATHDQALQTKFMQIKYFKQKQAAYADSENNLMRQQNTL